MPTLPTRYVFDEGHHLFDAADAAFSVRLSGHEGRELRRWLLGAEAGRSRARGLRRRIGDLVEADEEARGGAGRGTGRRPAFCRPISGTSASPTDKPLPGFEAFLALVRQQVLARAACRRHGYRHRGRGAAADRGADRGRRRGSPPRSTSCRRRCAASPRGCGAGSKTRRTRPTRQCVSGSTRSCAASSAAPIVQLGGWRALLRDLGEPPRPETVDWFASSAFEGREIDVGMNRHWIDPGIPFAAAVAQPAHGCSSPRRR